MEYRLDAADQAFADEVRAFLASALPAELARHGSQNWLAERPESAEWTRILHARGWSAPHWPAIHGGTGWSPLRRYLFDVECCLAGAPITNITGFDLVGPVIYTFGNPAQQARFLPPILRGEEFWCQGFSEPNAGSDLTSLRTRAVRAGAHYVVNGQKMWTSGAGTADFVFLLVRTDPTAAPQRGISFLLADLRTPGITRRPIRSIDGAAHLHEVFFDDVRVPVENLVGAENHGWGYAKFLLGNERAFSGVDAPRLKRYLRQIRALAALPRPAAPPLLADAAFASRLAELEISFLALETSILQVLHEPAQTSTEGWPTGSMLKIRGTELQQQMSALLLECLGDAALETHPHGIPAGGAGGFGDSIAADFFYRRASSIYGGALQIQKNIIARAVLGK